MLVIYMQIIVKIAINFLGPYIENKIVSNIFMMRSFQHNF